MKIYGYNCYKCETTEELSPKKILDNGSIVFMCKTCRKVAYQALKASLTPPKRKNFNMKEWRTWAKSQNSALSAKYANEQFMRLRGLILAESNNEGES